MSSQVSSKARERYDWNSSQASLKSKAQSSRSSLRSKASKARYAVQAWVPASAYLSPNLRHRLKNFALKPMQPVSSPLRRQELRQEIESRNISVNAADTLWNSNTFAFVAEAKAKTIQLRHRTLELLRKTDDSEAMARSLWEEEQTPPEEVQDGCSNVEGGDVEGQDSFEPLPDVNSSPKSMGGPESAAEGDDDVTTEEKERRVNKIKTMKSKMRQRLMSTTMLDDKIFKTPRRSSSDIGEVSPLARKTDGPLMRRKRAEQITVQSADVDPDLSEFDDDISGTPCSCREEAMGKDRGCRLTPRSTVPANLASPRGSATSSPANSATSVSRRMSRPGSSTSSMATPFSPWSTSSRLSNVRRSRNSVMDKSTILCEDVREIDYSGTSRTCILRLCGDRFTGGFSLEACADRGERRASVAPFPPIPIKRCLAADEVEELFAWGQMEERSPSEKYSWLFDLVSVTVGDDQVAVISLGDWDVYHGKAIDTERRNSRMQDLAFTGDMRKLFETNVARSSMLSGEEDWSEWSKQRNLAKSNTSFEARKEKDISMLAVKHAMDPSAAEALSRWYQRIDPEGIGKIDDELFTAFIQKILHTGQRSFQCEHTHQEIRWLVRELHATRSDCAVGGHLAFAQFADWLIAKFPQITIMSAYEINRFSELAQEVHLTDSPRTSLLQHQLSDLLKRKEEQDLSSVVRSTRYWKEGPLSRRLQH